MMFLLIGLGTRGTVGTIRTRGTLGTRGTWSEGRYNVKHATLLLYHVIVFP